MIQMTLFLPLVISGVAGALWREHRQKKRQPVVLSPDFPALTLSDDDQESSKDMSREVVVIDDATEIAHNQRVSLIALALSGSGSLVFPPFTLASIPLLSYSTFYFVYTVHRSTAKRKKSALTVFELASVAGAILTGRYLLLSSLLSLSFSIRKWALHAGNISSIGIGTAFDPNFGKIWVLRDKTEIEIDMSELQPDDVAVLHAGDIIRLHAKVVEGEGMVKQFSLTGMLQAVPKQPADLVFPYTKVAAGNLCIKYS
jgi:hypothetical protein